jgi:diguanylate cyclase (GGDEF)-like protein
VRTDVLRDLTREARTALESILGYTELLVEDLGGAHPGASDDLARIRAASQHVMSLVTRLEHQVDSARREADRDPLTGVANRRVLEARAASILATDGELSLLLIDLDRFKEVNDRFGHLVGDEVLRAVVERCRRAVRDTDLIARFAGDEFVLLLPGSPHAVAQRVAARVAHNVSADPVRTQRGPVPITASVGVATRQGGDRSLELLIDRADRAMYEVKAKKRLSRQSPKGPPSA